MLDLSSTSVKALILAGLAAAVPASANPLRRQTARSEACAEIGRAYDEARSSKSSATVKPSVAYECLRSIPVDVERDVALIKYLRPWLEFQSTIGILPDPPEEYLYPGVDIFGGFDNITRAVEGGEYDSQYDFALDLYRLINVKPREGHLGYTPVLGSLLDFDTPELFISISVDGLKTPKVYLHSDYTKSVRQDYEASEVTKFDDASIVDYLQQRSVDNSRDQDPDAAYNEQLFTAALDNTGQTAGAGRYMHTTLSDESVIELANGTKLTMTNLARVNANFSGITSGEDVHRRFEVPDRYGEAEGSVNTTQTSFSPSLDGLPDPFVIHRDRYVTGYHPETPKLDDTAVLVVSSFTSQVTDRRTGDDVTDFIRVHTHFVERSRRERRSKLVIDLQGNGGGYVASAMSMYAVLFPEGGDAAHMNMRLRAHAALDWVGTTAQSAGVDPQDLPYPFGYSGFLDENLRNFSDWRDFYGPETIGGREYTNVVQPGEMRFAATGAPGFEIPEPWFEPKDTVIVTDGHCASACAYVVGMMARELGVQTVALGGRPIEAPMQAIGGTKGGPVITLYPYQLIYPALEALAVPPGDVDVTPFADPTPPLAGPSTESWAVNSANVYLDDDLDGTPVQFRYEAANCKLFFTWETLTDFTKLWEAVVNVKWNGAKCVKGSTTNADGTMGSTTPAYSDKVVSSFKWAAGPGDVAEKAKSGGGSENGGGDGGGGGGGAEGGDGGGGEAGNDENAAGNVRISLWTTCVVAFVTIAVYAM
ncbi:Peptidase S41 family protein ustP [Colletotrichum spinosum]|uniref:Peptidase S41 family protein ustP n=1 Tax=Colletotrichum spinosum TaxID=1347390 RepID=A0A4R8PXL5_9PEZI|nr:Peptidase S41 family protein ustP [Colletotrichum spinosum]